jgi:hypothetical protein
MTRMATSGKSPGTRNGRFRSDASRRGCCNKLPVLVTGIRESGGARRREATDGRIAALLQVERHPFQDIGSSILSVSAGYRVATATTSLIPVLVTGIRPRCVRTVNDVLSLERDASEESPTPQTRRCWIPVTSTGMRDSNGEEASRPSPMAARPPSTPRRIRMGTPSNKKGPGKNRGPADRSIGRLCRSDQCSLLA